MIRHYSWLQKFRFSVIVIISYTLLITGGWYLLQPSSTSKNIAHAAPKNVQPTKVTPKIAAVSGKPVSIVIPAANIDLPVTDGHYSELDGSWTLSDTNAQFATITMPPNNISGNTFIYGHGTDPVFARLANTPLAIGAQALIYTDNGHIFSYLYQSTREITPDDTSVFDYEGPPILTIQTCTGMFSEWRSLYQFSFEKVVQ